MMVKDFGVVYFGTEEGAKKALELFGDEINEVMGV
jgi:hypothetical protein